MKYRTVLEWLRSRKLIIAGLCLLGIWVIPGNLMSLSTATTIEDAGQRRAEAVPSPSPTPAKGIEALGEPPPLPVLRATPTPAPEGQEIDPNEVIKIDTSIVNLNVRVIDRNNRPINNVRQDEFRVFEDGVLQSVVFFSREEVPISYGLAVDNSGSMRSQLGRVIEATRAIINKNKSGDETFLVRFVDSKKIETLRDFTSNKEDLIDGLDDMYIQGGQTAVIDAVYLSAERVAQYKKGSDLNDRRRRALIVVTDGEDRSSYYKQEQLFAMLRESDVQIYVIGFINELERQGGFIRKSPRQRARSLIDRIVRETGGRAFYPESLTELPTIAEEITRDLRTQYVIGYSPTNKARDGSYRTIRVQIADRGSSRNKRIALARAGYIAPRDDSVNSTPDRKKREASAPD